MPETHPIARSDDPDLLLARLFDSLSALVRADESCASAEDIADILYLAAVRNFCAFPTNLAAAAAVPEGAADTPGDAADSPKEPVETGDTPSVTSEAPPHSARKESHEDAADDKVVSDTTPLYVPGPAPDGFDSSRQDVGAALTFRAPGARALLDPLSFARAFKPLKRRVPSRTQWLIDIDETVRNAADSGGELWNPLQYPAPEPWMEAALVVDAAVSMAVWVDTLEDLRGVLERQGAFRDIRVYRFDARRPRKTEELPQFPSFGTADGRTRLDPRRLLSAGAGGYLRLIVIATDATGPAWRDGRAARLLALWAARHPVAVLQMLPEQRWVDTGLALGSRQQVYVSDSSLNSPPRYSLMESDAQASSPLPRTSSGRVLVPVVPLEAGRVADLARALVRGGQESPLVAYLLPTYPTPPPVRSRVATVRDDSEVRQRRLRRAVRLLSPTALELARKLAAAPLRLSIMRLVQRLTLPESGPVHLAEILLSGLIRRAAGDPPASPGGFLATRTSAPDNMAFAFVDGAREALLADASVPESLEVFRTISRYVAARLGHAPVDINALLSIPDGAEVPAAYPLPPGAEPFAEVAAALLRRLGGRYTEVAAQLDARRSHRPPAPHTWVLVAGLGTYELPIKVLETSERLGEMLAKEGYGLIVGGWQGVDHVVARKFVEVLTQSGRSAQEFLVQVVGPNEQPDYPKGPVIIAQTFEEQFTKGVAQAHVVVLISGVGGTLRVGATARDMNKPVFPLADTDGDAHEAYRSILDTWDRKPIRGISKEEFTTLNTPAPQVIDHLMKLIRKSIGARQMVQIGEVRFPNNHPKAHEFYDGKHKGPRELYVSVTFDHPFTRPPKVVVSLQKIDLQDVVANIHRIAVRAENIRLEGFDLYFETWDDSIIYNAGASWIAVGE